MRINEKTNLRSYGIQKFTVVVIAAVMASLMLAGTILAPIQSYAAVIQSKEWKI
jgi:hypothetical protein